jgi:hypothetical protein
MTKNLLLGSTALVGAIALATPALADIEVTLSGQVEFGTKIGEGNANDQVGKGYFFFMDSETKIQAEGASDSGINYSAKVELETDADRTAVVTADGAGNNDGVINVGELREAQVNADETVIAFWGGFGRAELGREDGAADNMFVGGEDFQAGTGGIDGDATNLALPGVADSGDAAKVTYFTPRIGGFQLGASYTADTGDDEELNNETNGGEFFDHVEVGANFTTSASGADVTLTGVGSFGSGKGANADLEDYGIGGGVEFAGLGIGAGYIFNQDVNSGDGFTIGAKYGFGPANVSAGFSRRDRDASDAENVYVVSADYGLFPGVTLKGDIAHNDSDPASDDNGGTTAGVVTIQVDY